MSPSCYDEIREISRDPKAFSSVTGALAGEGFQPPGPHQSIYEAHGFLPINTFVVADPPLHTFHRSLVARAFNAVALKRTVELITRTVAHLVDGFVDKRGGIFHDDEAVILPTLVIADHRDL